MSPVDGSEQVDVVVSGAGPCGLTVAIHCARRGLRVLSNPFQVNGEKQMCWARLTGLERGSSRLRIAGLLLALSGLVACGSKPKEPMAGLKSIVAGYGFTCALRDDGKVVCWGEVPGRKKGDNDPSPLPLPAKATAVAASSHGVCALTAKKGAVYCWTGQRKKQPPVRERPVDDGAKEVTLGELYGCARKADGSVWCWSTEAQGGKPGHSTGLTEKAQRIPLPEPAVAIMAAARTACAVGKKGVVYCWGSPDAAPFGSPIASTFSKQPAPLRGMNGIRRLWGAQYLSLWNSDRTIHEPEGSWGSGNYCASGSDDQVWCWGFPGARLVD